MKQEGKSFGKLSSISTVDSQYPPEKFPSNLAKLDLNLFNSVPPSPFTSMQNRQKYSPSNFLKVYFDFMYLLLACPFRVELDTGGSYIIRKFKPQQVCCIIMQGLCTIRLLTEVRISIEKEYKCQSVSKNPVQYFNIILDVCSLIYKLITMKRLWIDQAEYLNVLNYVYGRGRFKEGSAVTKTLRNIVFLRCFFALVTTHVFASLFVGKKFIAQSVQWSPSFWRNQLVKLARYTFFLNDNFSKGDTTLLQRIMGIDEFLAFVTALSMLQRYIFGLFCDVFLLCFSMTLWTASYSFSHKLRKDEDKYFQWDSSEETLTNVGSKKEKDDERSGYHSWKEVYEDYREIQKLSMGINRALGNQVTWFLGEAIMYYSVYLNAVLTSTDIFVRIDLAFFYFNTFAVLLVAANICSQVERIKLWISFGENRKSVPSDEFSIVLHEMLAKDIGIRGSDIFTITYSLLGMFLSTIVTYFIICIQQGHDVASRGSNGTANTLQCDM